MAIISKVIHEGADEKLVWQLLRELCPEQHPGEMVLSDIQC